MTLSQLYRHCTHALEKASTDAVNEARLIVFHVLGISAVDLILKADDEVPEASEKAVLKALERRLDGTPVAYITGERAFFECVFKVTDDVLIPQPDTEILVESAIEDIKGAFKPSEEVCLLDLCTGTGCVGISIAKTLARTFRSIDLVMTDVSKKALEVCNQNARNLVTEKNISTSILEGSLLEPVRGMKFDAIVSNPPYIKSSVIPGLDIQVRNEPLIALDGGTDGLDFYREIAGRAPSFLHTGGLIALETGFDQADEVSLLLEDSGFGNIEVVKDLAGLNRVVKGRLKD